MQSDGVYVKPRYPLVYFDDIHSKTMNGVQEEQRECQEDVYKIREKLAMLIAGNPKDLMSEDDWEEYGGASAWITAQLNEIEEDLQITLRKYGRLEVYENLLYEWEDEDWSRSSEYSTIYDRADLSSEEDRNIVFPEPKQADDKDRWKISLGMEPATEKSIDEVFENGFKNIELEEHNQRIIENLVFARICGKVFCTYTGQWLFKNEDECFKAIKDKLSIQVSNYSTKKFIEAHPEFFKSVAKELDNEEQDRLHEYVNDVNSLGTIMSKNYQDFYSLLNKAFDHYILSKVNFLHVNKLI